MQSFLEHFPVATAVSLIIAITGAILLIVNGDLGDFALYAGIVSGGNGLVAIGRGLIPASAKK